MILQCSGYFVCPLVVAWVVGRNDCYPPQGGNFKWRTPVKIAGNNQNLKRFMYSKPDFDGLSKILAVFEG